jgi:hypothetical protein
MTKTVTITHEDFAAAVQAHADAAPQVMGLTGAAAASAPADAGIDVKGLIDGGLCGLLAQIKPMIKTALRSEGYIGTLAYGVINDLVFDKLCPPKK